MSLNKKQFGFSGVEVLILVVLVGLLVTLGYVAYSQIQADAPAESTETSQQAATTEDVPAAPEINSTSDLDKASSALDSADLDASDDSTSLDEELNNF